MDVMTKRYCYWNVASRIIEKLCTAKKTHPICNLRIHSKSNFVSAYVAICHYAKMAFSNLHKLSKKWSKNNIYQNTLESLLVYIFETNRFDFTIASIAQHLRQAAPSRDNIWLNDNKPSTSEEIWRKFHRSLENYYFKGQLLRHPFQFFHENNT